MRCSQCSQEHPVEVMELTFRRPDAVVALPAEERARDVRESDDVCHTRGGRFFVRGVLPLPVAGRDEPYRIGLWVEVDEAAYGRVHERWNDPDQADEPAMPARVANAIPTLPDTLGLDAALRLTGPRSRPDIFVADPSHPLALEQAHGITGHRAFEYTLIAASGSAGPVH
jgi:hypothetical protein